MDWNPKKLLGNAAGIDFEALQSMLPKLEQALSDLACMPELQARLIGILQNEFGSAVVDSKGNILGGFDPRAAAETDYAVVPTGETKTIDFTRQLVRGHIAIKGSSDGEAVISLGTREANGVSWKTIDYHLEAGEILDFTQWVNVIKIKAVGGVVKAQMFGQSGGF